MDSLHRNQGGSEKLKKQNLQYQGTSVPGLKEAPMLTLGCSISMDHNHTNQSQSSKDKGKHVDNLDSHIRDNERGSLKLEPGRHVTFTASSSSLSDGITFVRSIQDEQNHSTDNMLDSEENETMPVIKSAQRIVKQNLDGCGRNAALICGKGIDTQDSKIQPERQQCEVSGDNVITDKKHAAVEGVCQKSESSDPPLGSHNCSCSKSLGTNGPEGFQAEMASMNEVQINQDMLGNENSNCTQDSPHQEHSSVMTPSNEFKGWMEGIMKIESASQFQWPKWTVSYLLHSSNLDTLVAYYRILNLANNLNDEDLRLFLEEQLHKEKAGLSEDIIRRRLRTRIHGSSTALTELGAMGENSETCSICVAEFKDLDRVASLYYCPHEYHADCIGEWLLKSNVCPLCRALAIIPEQYPDWNGDIRLHRAFFMTK